MESFRALYCGSLALIFLAYLPRQARFLGRHGQRLVLRPVLGVWKMPRLRLAGVLAAGVAFAVSLLFVSADLLRQMALAVAFVSYFLYFAHAQALDEAKRKTFLIPIVLAVLFVSPWLEPGWPFLFIKMALAQVYLSSAIQKMRNSPSDWLSGRALLVSLKWAWLQVDSKPARWLGERVGLCRVLSIGILVFELAFVAVLFSPPEVTVLLACLGLFFHLANAIVLKINYLPFLGPTYFVFFPEFLQLVSK